MPPWFWVVSAAIQNSPKLLGSLVARLFSGLVSTAKRDPYNTGYVPYPSKVPILPINRFVEIVSAGTVVSNFSEFLYCGWIIQGYLQSSILGTGMAAVIPAPYSPLPMPYNPNPLPINPMPLPPGPSIPGPLPPGPSIPTPNWPTPSIVEQQGPATRKYLDHIKLDFRISDVRAQRAKINDRVAISALQRIADPDRILTQAIPATHRELLAWVTGTIKQYC